MRGAASDVGIDMDQVELREPCKPVNIVVKKIWNWNFEIVKRIDTQVQNCLEDGWKVLRNGSVDFELEMKENES